METKRNHRIRYAIQLALGVGIASAVSSAPAIAEETTHLDTVQVTGSRLQRVDVETATPVYVMSHEEIKAGGYQRIEDILNSLPQIEAGQTAFISNGSTLTATVDLRGLGSDRTLVLVNGRRLPPGGVYTNSPDINQIPAAMVERVEVLTGGGSSVYGADAVAGVVNFILRKDFDGVEISYDWSGYQHKNDNKWIQGLMDDVGYEYPTGSTLDGKSKSLSIVMGGLFDDGKGHATAYISHRKVEALLQGSRDYSSCALSASGVACGGSQTAPIPNFHITPAPDGEPDHNVLWQATLAPDSSFVDMGGNIYNFNPVNFFQRPDERWALGAFVGYEISDTWQPYMELNFMHDHSVAQVAESGTFFDPNWGTFLISLENRDVFSEAQALQLQEVFGLDSDDSVLVSIGKRNVEGGGRQDRGDHASYRFVVGTKGDLGTDWSYDMSYLYTAVTGTTSFFNDFYGPRVRQAIGVDQDCNDGCVPYRVFTYNGVTPEAAKYVQAKGTLAAHTSLEAVNAFVSGFFDLSLPTAASPIGAVLGFERRTESYELVADEVYEGGLLLGQGGTQPSIFGSYDVNEVFTELSIPLVESSPLAERLALELGARYSDYSNFGAKSTYKVALDWSPINAVKVRGAYNRAIRAPNNIELHLP